MSYKINGLDLSESKDSFCVLAFDNITVPKTTRVEIPAKINGKPVTEIGMFSFENDNDLREVIVPDCLEKIYRHAFYKCPELSVLRLPKTVKIEPRAFLGCGKLPAEVVMAGLVGGFEDYSAPFITLTKEDISGIMPIEFVNVEPNAAMFIDWDGVMRPDVFELVMKYKNFREIDIYWLYFESVDRGLVSHLDTLIQAGYAPDLAQTNDLIDLSLKNKNPEMTAYLLEYKRRKFGFAGFGEDDSFEL